ncbi:Uncharacterised protein [Mycobacteroides abscessus]|nr:Uncharacterised protein [Mycobacteroides abscessus]
MPAAWSSGSAPPPAPTNTNRASTIERRFGAFHERSLTVRRQRPSFVFLRFFTSCSR